jgi:predicted ATPase
MSKIKVHNFGPIKAGYEADGGWIDVKKVTVFIGNQGSGKSTLAKLISTFTWMEKALVRGDVKAKDFEIYNRFRKKHCAYQNIHNYFRTDTIIEFSGTAYSFSYQNSNFKVRQNKNNKYLVPKVMYVPAERNFVSAVAQPEKLRYLPQTLYTFLEEFERSKYELKESLVLPINNLSFEYESKKGTSKLIGNGYEVALSEASSGLQSLVPLFLVTKNLAEGIDKEGDFAKNRLSLEEKQKVREQLIKILLDKKLSTDLQNTAVDLLSSVTKNDCFFNVVEEPEQNLFPSSQRSILNSLLQFNSKNGNQLILTTHSPYIVNYLTLVVKAHSIVSKAGKRDDILKKINEIVPLTSTINSTDLAIYELDDLGKIVKLGNYNGVPSDENYLNEKLADANSLFTELLEIEDLCRQ